MIYIIFHILAQSPLVVPSSWLQLLKDWGSAGAVIFVVFLFLRENKNTNKSFEKKLEEMNERNISSNEAMFDKLEKIDNRSTDVLVKIAETMTDHNNVIRVHSNAIADLKNELQEIRLLGNKQSHKEIEGY